MTYKPPAESVFDEDGNVIELGQKFYGAADEMLILLPDSTEWQLPQYIEDMPTTNINLYSDLGDDFTPVSDNDTTGFGKGRVS